MGGRLRGGGAGTPHPQGNESFSRSTPLLPPFLPFLGHGGGIQGSKSVVNLVFYWGHLGGMIETTTLGVGRVEASLCCGVLWRAVTEKRGLTKEVTLQREGTTQSVSFIRTMIRT